MLYVFAVDIGVMYTFEMELAMESVQTLMSAIASNTGVPMDKQVLLITDGEALNPSDRVCNYSNAGTDTSPIYLFSKSIIESSIPPSSSLTFGSESSLKEKVEVSFRLPPTYETVVSRSQLASEFHHFAGEIADNCDGLISEQSFQQLGWAAVVANLDNFSRAFNERVAAVQQSYKEFLEARPQYLELLNGYGDILHTLAKIPVLPTLLSSQHFNRPDLREDISLIDWISAQDHKNSLQDMVTQCTTAIEQFDETELEAVMTDVSQVQDALNNSSMKEIKGLDERLTLLQQLLQKVKELVQAQADMAQGFIQNQTRAQNIGDASVLPDLCSSHQKQLMMLLKNHSHLRDYLRRSAKAKEELSVNLHTRLRWIMYVEKRMCDSDSTLVIYHENIRRIRRRLDILEQVSEAPKLYVKATLEVVRRRRFSSQFLKWANKLHENITQMLSEENARREEFTIQFGRHFLQTLFTGLEDRPPKFVDKPPKPFDCQLPIITDHHLEHLHSLLPKFKEYLDESPINVSMRDDETHSLLLKLQESEMSASKAAMSVDASTQAVWITGGGQVIDESKDSNDKGLDEGAVMSRSGNSTEESAPLVFQPAEDSPPKGYHKDSDTGSEPSSGLTDSDIMFRSAQEDYVNVVDADFDSKDSSFTHTDNAQESLMEGRVSSQTLTLTSSGSQSTTASTQTDISYDGMLSSSQDLDDEQDKADSLSNSKETLVKFADRAKELEAELNLLKVDYDRLTKNNKRLTIFKQNISEIVQNFMDSMRAEFNTSKDLISNYNLKMKEELELAWKEVQRFSGEMEKSVSKLTYERTKEEYEQIIQQIREKYDLEREELLNCKAELQGEKDKVSVELSHVIEERNSKESKNAEDLEKVTSLLDEYKTKCEEQHNTLMKVKESDNQSEEDKQTRYNAIIMRLKREKDQTVGHLNGKIKEMEKETENLRGEILGFLNEREFLYKEKELQEITFLEKEKKLTTMVDTAEREVQQIQRLMEGREKDFQGQLEKEKANALLLLEVERQMWEVGRIRQRDAEMVEIGKMESGVSSVSIDYIQRVQQLEQENQLLKERLLKQTETMSQAVLKFGEGEVNPVLKQAQQALLDKEEHIKALKKQLTQQAASGAGAQKPEKVSLKDFQCGDVILLVFDPRYENYLVFSTGSTLYFLHPESMTVLDLATSGTKRRDWVLAQLCDKEYCQAKKANNRFHVPVGTKFYRIQVKPWER